MENDVREVMYGLNKVMKFNKCTRFSFAKLYIEIQVNSLYETIIFVWNHLGLTYFKYHVCEVSLTQILSFKI